MTCHISAFKRFPMLRVPIVADRPMHKKVHSNKLQFNSVFTARCYASAGLAMGLCLSVCVCLCLCLSVTSRILLKRLNGGSHKQHHTIPQRVLFSDAKDLREIRPVSPPTRAPNADGVGQNRRLSTNSWLYLEDGTR